MSPKMSEEKRKSLAAFNEKQTDWYTARKGRPVLKGSLAEIKKQMALDAQKSPDNR